MKYEEIIKLLDAGYTREEILEMKNEPTPEPDPVPEQDPAPEPQPADIMSEVKSMFAEMKKELTAMNILNSRQHEDVKTTDDILANIINPTSKNGGK